MLHKYNDIKVLDTLGKYWQKTPIRLALKITSRKTNQNKQVSIILF